MLLTGEGQRGAEASINRAVTNFSGAFRNSLVVATTKTAISLLLGTLAAYGFTRLDFPGKRFLFFGVLGSRMIPPVSVVIPLYLIMRSTGLMDTRTGLIITYMAMMLPLVIWIMAAFFQSLPKEIEEAALIDGCSRLQALVRIMIPISVPGLVASAVVAFLFAWNEFFFALIFTQTMASKTLPKAISEFSSEMGAGLDYGLVTTGGVLTSLPPLIIAFVFQRYLVRGLTGGTTKA